MRAAVLLSLVAATGTWLAACGGGSGPPPGGGTSATAAATIVRLGPDDSGRTVTLAVGDRLLVALSGGRLNGSWAVTSYPRPVLTVDEPSASFGGVALVAREAGSGQVVLVRVLCGPVVDPPPCAGGSGVGPASTAPTRWTVTVVVR